MVKAGCLICMVLSMGWGTVTAQTMTVGSLTENEHTTTPSNTDLAKANNQLRQFINQIPVECGEVRQLLTEVVAYNDCELAGGKSACDFRLNRINALSDKIKASASSQCMGYYSRFSGTGESTTNVVDPGSTHEEQANLAAVQEATDNIYRGAQQASENMKKSIDAINTEGKSMGVNESINDRDLSLKTALGGSLIGSVDAFEDPAERPNETAQSSAVWLGSTTEVIESSFEDLIGQSGHPLVEAGHAVVSKYRAVTGAMDGRLNSEAANEILGAVTREPVIRAIQEASVSMAIDVRDATMNVMDGIGDQSLTSEDINAVVHSLRPSSQILPTVVKENRPWSVKDTLFVVAGGVALSALAVPVMTVIGVGAWYGFSR